MKKLKKIWQENSVLLVLFLILIACLVAMSIVVVTYFVGDGSSKYGDRLEDASKYPFQEDKQKEIVSKLEEEELIEKASIRTSGKRIIVTIKFVPKTTLVEAQSKALASVEYFSEEILGFYDIEYMIKADSTEESEGFQIIGSHNVSGTGGIVWNNNTAIDKEK
ncbi:MAG: hypothetical protein HFI36_02910 [Bacilli bacterium]|jgi:hypothetical protein|nr:hypothetical protein [Bacilli bacterium]MCX4254445.1 hypothetical protein [Bacilli bacterium]